MKQIIIIIIASLSLGSCNLIKSDDVNMDDAVARVGNKYLFKDEIATIVPEGTAPQDSMLIVNNYINSWATKNLLVQNAQKNLTEEQVKEFNQLVEDYRTDLYTKTYKEALVLRALDTSVSKTKLDEYYQNNKDNFKLNSDILKARYISVPVNNNNLASLKKKLSRFNEEDQRALDSLSYQFSSFSLNDSLWVKASQLVEKIPPLTDENSSIYLKKSQFFELQDSLGVYLVKIEDYKKRGEVAPLNYMKPTLKQIILNQRKNNFLRNLEKDIIKDAIQDGQYQLYE